MELSNDWHKRTNLKLMDILSDIMKEPRPPRVAQTPQSPKPSHGYTIAEKKPEVVTAPGVYFPATHGEVLSPERYAQKTGLISRQEGGEVKPAAPMVPARPSLPLGSFRPQAAAPPQDFGPRPDGTPKGPGFMGTMQRPDNKVSTELSIGVNIGGKEVQIPMLVPTLTPEEVKYLLGGGKPTDAIVGKAVEHAKSRMAQGQSPFAQEGEQAATPPTPETPPQSTGSTVPLESRQEGGEVDPSLFKETSAVGVPNPAGDEKALANIGSLSSFAPPRVPTTSVFGQTGVNTGYYDAHPEEKNATVTPASPAPLTGMAEYEANANKMRGFTPATPSTVGPTAPAGPIDKRLNLPTGALSSFMKPVPTFRENRSSPVFGSDQRAAFDKKWKPYQDFMKSLGKESTPLFPRQEGGDVSPTIDENLTKEQRLRLYQEYQAKLANKDVVDLTPNSTGTFEAKTPAEAVKAPVTTPTSLSEIKKEPLPSGETRYTLPGTEGTATVGPERFFVGEKEVPKGTAGAVSGDEVARQNVLSKASTSYSSSPEMEERKKWATPGYREAKLDEAQKISPPTVNRFTNRVSGVIGVTPGYEPTRSEAHPEEAFMDMSREENKPAIDSIQKALEENKRIFQGFGTSMNPKERRAQRLEAEKNIPILTEQLARIGSLSAAMPEKYYSADARVAAAEAKAGRAASAPKPETAESQKLQSQREFEAAGLMLQFPMDKAKYDKLPDETKSIIAKGKANGFLKSDAAGLTDFAGTQQQTFMERAATGQTQVGTQGGREADKKAIMEGRLTLADLSSGGGMGGVGGNYARDIREMINKEDPYFNYKLQEARVKGNTKEILGIREQMGKLMPFAETAKLVATDIVPISRRVWRTGVPLLNMGIVKGELQVTGNTAAAELNHALVTFVDEYARVVTTATGGGVTTDTSRKQIAEAINMAQTPEQLEAVLKNALGFMQHRETSFGKVLDDVEKQFGVSIPGGAPKAPGATGAPGTTGWQSQLNNFGGNPAGGGAATNVMTEQAAREALKAKGVIGAEQDNWINQYKKAGKVQ